MTSNKGYTHADPFNTGKLPVGDIHVLHYEQYGKPDGKPVIFLHGGPGGGTSKANTAFFDPEIFMVVLVDQRGAGKSTPWADIRENTTDHLVADIETLREHLSISKWAMVFGGSWGSTLALSYAQAHPQMVGCLVLRGIFLCNKAEIQWGYTVSTEFFPEVQEAFYELLTPEERKEPELSYYKRMQSEDSATKFEAAKRWNAKELHMSLVNPGPEFLTRLDDEKWSLPHALIEAHYFVNDCFLEEDQLVKNAHKINHIPTSIVQGRLDMVCPPRYAWALHKAMPNSRLDFIGGAGHAATEPGTFERLVEICDEYAKL